MRKDEYNFNFFNASLSLESMCNYFELDQLEVINYLVRFSECDFLEFIKRFDVDLYKYDSSKAFIRCRHITTSNEKLESFKKYGLLNLKQALTLDTPLKTFLKERGIEFDVDSKLLFYKGKKSELFWHDIECKKCNYGICNYLKNSLSECTNSTYRDMSCDYRKGITQLYGKLYNDKAETEVFLSGEYDKIYDYSIVSKSPEILLTIDNTIKRSFGEHSNLEYDWGKIENNQAYLLEFYTNIKNLELVGTNRIYNGYSFIDEILDYYNELTDIEMDANFYRNMFLLINSIYAFYGYPKEYGQLYPDTIIPFNTLEVFKFDKSCEQVKITKEEFIY